MRGDRNAIIGIARLANDCRRPVGADGIHCARIQHKERGRNRPSSASWRADLMEITAAPHVIGADFQDELWPAFLRPLSSFASVDDRPLCAITGPS
jgi:hypothetical protein